METHANAVTVDNPYGLGALWAQGDPIARGVLILLLLMSLFSWYIMLTKVWDQRKLRRAARVVEKQFWSAPSLKDGVERLPKNDDFRSIAEDGLRAASHHDGRLTDRIDLHEWITLSLQRSVEHVNGKLQTGLAFLATVGSVSPFVGLFGTVWGILNALVSIGIALITVWSAIAISYLSNWPIGFFVGAISAVTTAAFHRRLCEGRSARLKIGAAPKRGHDCLWHL